MGWGNGGGEDFSSSTAQGDNKSIEDGVVRGLGGATTPPQFASLYEGLFFSLYPLCLASLLFCVVTTL